MKVGGMAVLSLTLPQIPKRSSAKVQDMETPISTDECGWVLEFKQPGTYQFCAIQGGNEQPVFSLTFRKPTKISFVEFIETMGCKHMPERLYCQRIG